jgi:hypothetical protein
MQLGRKPRRNIEKNGWNWMNKPITELKKKPSFKDKKNVVIDEIMKKY